MIRRFALILFLAAGFPVESYADTLVQFTNKELSAAFVLVRPELNTLELNGQSGTFTPSPALKFVGVDEQNFQINFGALINLVDVEFNHVRSKELSVNFKNGSFEITVPVEDQAKAIQSKLGSISLSGVSVTAVLGWMTDSSGSPRLTVTSTRFNGNLSGTGVLKPVWILNQLKSLLTKTLSKVMSQILAQSPVQDSVVKGLLGWAKFYTGIEYHSLTPGSTHFFNDGASSGLEYQVSR